MKARINWQPIFGDFDFEKGRVEFLGRELQGNEPETHFPLLGMAVCDQEFSGGKISMIVEYENAPAIPTVQIIIWRDPQNNSYIAAGLDGGFRVSGDMACFAVTSRDASPGGRGPMLLTHTDFVRRPPKDKLELAVRQSGSLLDLYANDVLVLRHFLTPALPPSQCGIHCAAASKVRIGEYAVNTECRKAFVIMQFSEPFQDLFSEVIEPVATQCGLVAEKADDVLGPGLIITDVINKIQQAAVVIADITPLNANVYYEIGYAHAIGKPTVLMAEKGVALPFDISGFRTLFYENSIGGKAHIEEALRRHIEAIVCRGS